MKGKINVVFIVSIILSLAFGMNVMATGFVDMPTNWGKEPMEKAIENGLLVGHEGRVNPNGNMTRAELATVVNKVFGNTAKADISAFQDVPKDSWYYGEIQKAFKANLLSGSNGKMNPNRPLTREEAFVILGRAFDIAEGANAAGNFKDGNNVADWAKANINGLVANGYIKGANGNINPKGKITRAEFASIIDQLAAGYVSSSGVYNKDIKGNLIVRSSDVILKGVKIDGDLILAEGVLNSNVVLDGVEVTGRILVKGAGRLTLENGSKVNAVVVLNESVDATVEVSKDSSIEEVQLKSKARVDGEGQVKSVYLYEGANNSVIKTEGTTIESKAPGVAPTDGKVIEIPKEKEPTGTTGSTSSSRGGGGGSSSSGGSSDSGSTEPEKPVTPKPEDKAKEVTINSEDDKNPKISGSEFKNVTLVGEFETVTVDGAKTKVIVPEGSKVDKLLVNNISKDGFEIRGQVDGLEVDGNIDILVTYLGNSQHSIEIIRTENADKSKVIVKTDKDIVEMKKEFKKIKFEISEGKINSISHIDGEEVGAIEFIVKDIQGNIIENAKVDMSYFGETEQVSKYIGISDTLFWANIGKYQYKVNADGYKPVVGEFDLKEIESITVPVELFKFANIQTLTINNESGVAKAEDLRFMVKSITKEGTEVQRVVGVGEVIDHFNTIPGLQEDFILIIKEINQNNIIIETGMSQDLLYKIKEKDGADKDSPYYITVLKGENKKTDKIFKLAYTMDGVKKVPVVDKTRANVKNEDELISALANKEIKTIVIENDISLSKQLLINREVTINGKGKTINANSLIGNDAQGHAILITGKDVVLNSLTVGSTKNGYGIQVYGSGEASLNNVTVSDSSKGGVLLNGGKLLADNLTLSNNTWGGIELSKGQNVTEEPKLIVKGNLNYKDQEGTIIWVDGYEDGNENWIDMTGDFGLTGIKVDKEGKAQYLFIREAEKSSVEKNLKEVLTKAKGYEYNPVYNYSHSKIEIVENTVNVEYKDITADNIKNVMNDLARYLGAMYRIDEGETVKAIEYNNEKYTWEGNLKGSNWKNNETTLIKKITNDFMINKDLKELDLKLVGDFDLVEEIKIVGKLIEDTPVTPLEPALKVVTVKNEFGITNVKDLRFMVKSITKEGSKVQKVATLEEVNTHFNTNYDVKDGYKLEVELKDNNLVFKTYMTEELFTEIKEKEGAVANTPYRITVLKGGNKKEDKIIKLAYGKEEVNFIYVAVENVEKLIAELPLVEALVLGDKAQVIEARASYEALTEEKQALVKAELVEKLKALELKLENLSSNESDKEDIIMKSLNEILVGASKEGSHNAKIENKQITVNFDVSSEEDIQNISEVLDFIMDVYKSIIGSDGFEEARSVCIIIGNEELEFKNDENGEVILKLAAIALSVSEGELFNGAMEFINAESTDGYKIDNFILQIDDLQIKDLSVQFGKVK